MATNQEIISITCRCMYMQSGYNNNYVSSNKYVESNSVESHTQTHTHTQDNMTVVTDVHYPCINLVLHVYLHIIHTVNIRIIQFVFSSKTLKNKVIHPSHAAALPPSLLHLLPPSLLHLLPPCYTSCNYEIT